jgi:hypothetical protein
MRYFAGAGIDGFRLECSRNEEQFAESSHRSGVILFLSLKPKLF